MKRTIKLFLALFCVATILLAKPYKQQGIAYLYDYKTKTKKPVANVSITVVGAQPTISKDDGTFSLVFDGYGLGDKVSFEKQPYYQGMKVFNKKEVDNWYIVKDRLRLIMCRYEEFELAKNNFYQQGLRAATAKYEREISQIKADQRLKEAEKNQKLQEAEEQLQQVMESLSETSETMARIDQSELDAAMQEVLDLYEQGNVEEAMKKLEDMKLEEKFIQTLDKKHEGERIVAEATEDSVLTLNKLRTSVDMYKNSGNWNKAAETLKLLADRLKTPDELFEYARFCATQNMHTIAIDYYIKAQVLYKQYSGEDSQMAKWHLANTLNNLGLLYNNIQKYEEAEKMHLQALEIRQTLVKDNPLADKGEVAHSLNNLANLYTDTQRLQEAEILYKKALAIRRQLAKENPSKYNADIAATLNNLALLYSDTQRLTEAEIMNKEALEIRRQLALYNPQDFEKEVALSLNNLAHLYSEQQNYPEAKTMYEEAVSIYQRLAEKNPQANEPDLAMSLNNLANIYNKTLDFTDAEAKYIYTREIYERLSRENPQVYEPFLAITLNNLACLYVENQRYQEAETAHKQALEIRRKLVYVNPKVHSLDMTQTLNNLSNLYRRTQRYHEAEKMILEAVMIRCELAKENPPVYEPYYAKSLSNMGLLYSETNRFQEANDAYKKSLEIRHRLVKENPDIYKTDLIDALLNCSFSSLFLKDFKGAENYAREGLSIDSTLYDLKLCLADALLFQGHFSEAEVIYRQYKDELKDDILDVFHQYMEAGVIPKEREVDVEKIKRMLEE